jgi:ornithine cyclodeaminase/alanine dehydrogenase
MMAAIELGLIEEANGTLVMPPRLNLPMREGAFRLMPAVLNGAGIMGYKVFYRVAGHGSRHMVALFEQDRGELLALVDANHLTAARTGATSGIASKFMARADSVSVAVIGSGLEARTNLAGVRAAFPGIQDVRVFSPNAERRQFFAREIGTLHGVEATPCTTAAEAVRAADIVVVGTNTSAGGGDVAFRGAWMEPGQHVVSVGSTLPTLREVDPTTFARADLVVVDAPAQATEESGDVVAAIASGDYPLDDVVRLADVVAGTPGRVRGSDEITLYKSVGTAMQDVASAFMLWQRAVETDRGRDIGDVTVVRPL